ncbi:MAG: outer membrane beta-barrel protein [Rhodomicrobium sp.]
MLRLGILSAVSALALTASANAADLYRGPADGGLKDGPYIPVATWTGFYIGANGGYAWSENSDLLSFSNLGTFAGVAPAGGFGGGQIGYNWQGFYHPNLVLGIEADIQGADIRDDGASSLGRDTHYSLDWFGTVRGRLGYACDRSLLYATGGFAYGGLHKWTTNGSPTDFNYNSTATGYTVGGGWEYKVAPAWSLKVEYQYIDLGRNDLVDPTGVNYANTRNLNTADDAFHTVRAGLNYHIGQGYEPLK